METLPCILTISNAFQAFLGFGTFSTSCLTMAPVNIQSHNEFSPIPIENTIYISPLPADGVKQLFRDWSSHRKILVEEEVLNHITAQTGWYLRCYISSLIVMLD